VLQLALLTLETLTSVRIFVVFSFFSSLIFLGLPLGHPRFLLEVAMPFGVMRGIFVLKRKFLQGASKNDRKAVIVKPINNIKPTLLRVLNVITKLVGK